MDFLLFLTPTGNQILNSLVSAKFHIYENSGPCRTEKIFGYLESSNKMFICTKNITSLGYDPYVYVNETLNHEAVHAVHQCHRRKTFGFKDAIGLKREDMYLPPEKMQDLRRSTSLTGNKTILEHEAFYLEDKPQQVVKYIKKFCF